MESNVRTRLKRVSARQTVTLTHYGRKSGKPYSELPTPVDQKKRAACRRFEDRAKKSKAHSRLPEILSEEVGPARRPTYCASEAKYFPIISCDHLGCRMEARSGRNSANTGLMSKTGEPSKASRPCTVSVKS